MQGKCERHSKWTEQWCGYITRFYAEQQKPKQELGDGLDQTQRPAKCINVNFVNRVGFMSKEGIALHLVRNATSARYRIISPYCANLGITVATSSENRSQAKEKKRLRRQRNILNPQARKTNFSVMLLSTSRGPRK